MIVDPLTPADYIVVLMGSIPDRVLGAVDLWQEEYADTLLMIREDTTGYNLAQARGISYPTQVDINRMIAVQAGIPEEDIVVLDGHSLSTQDEAIMFREYLLKNNQFDRTIILVTSQYHSRRSKMIFQKALSRVNLRADVRSYPTVYDMFQPKRWWNDRESAKRVVTEYLKMVNFVFREQFRL